jgi:hypothetical protein
MEGYCYPPSTAGADDKLGWFYHSLSLENNQVLATLAAWVKERNFDTTLLSKFELDPKLTLLRFLRANNFNLDATKAHILKVITWRVEEVKIHDIMLSVPDDILGCDIRELMQVYPHWHCGYDITGRPVLYKKYGYFDTKAISQITSIESLMKYHAFEQEACTALCTARSHERKEIIETVTAIVDVQNMKLAQVTSEFLGLIKTMASIDQTYYPETLGRIFIINTPSAFPIVWRCIKPWLSPIVASKIQVLSSMKEWQPVLSAFIGEDNLPSNYGGNLPPLSVDEHPYKDFMNIRKQLLLNTNTIEFEDNIPAAEVFEFNNSTTTTPETSKVKSVESADISKKTEKRRHLVNAAEAREAFSKLDSDTWIICFVVIFVLVMLTE